MRINRSFKMVCDQRAKITAGFKNEKGYPQSTDYFVIIDQITGEEIFPELVDAYGKEPKEFIVCFASNKLEDIFNDDYNLYGKTNTKKRVCNGVTCTHIIDETVSGNSYKAGTSNACICQELGLFETEDKELKKNKCSCNLYLKCHIFNPETGKVLNPLPYLFSSSSVHSADTIYSMLSKIPNLQGVPFKLSIKKVVKGTTHYNLWQIVPVILTSDLLSYSSDKAPELKEGNGQTYLTESTDYEEVGETQENESSDSETESDLNSAIKLIESQTTEKDVKSKTNEIWETYPLSKKEKEMVKAKALEHIKFINDDAEANK